jgi:hypothetical protein
MVALELAYREELPPEYLWLEGGQQYVVCAFYTSDYLRHVLVLKQSLESLGINHFLKCYERAATWEATTRIKPRFIEECLARFKPKHVLYIDADASVRQAPSFLDDVTTDVAVWLKARDKRGRHLRIGAGTVYVRNTLGGQGFVRAWREAERECNRLAVDGDTLQIALGNLSGITLTLFPRQGSKHGDGERPEAVFEQYHVSRERFKLRRALRSARRIATIVGLAAVAGSGVYVLLGP